VPSVQASKLARLHTPPLHAYPVAHPVLAPEQEVAHAPFVHAYPVVHEVVTWVQVPEMLQVPTAVTDVGVGQLAVPHVSPVWVWQPAPFVLHKALSPHVESVQPTEQQIFVEPDPFPMQWAFAHWLSVEQTCPSFSRQAPNLHV
jgi:hypothetical protein